MICSGKGHEEGTFISGNGFPQYPAQHHLFDPGDISLAEYSTELYNTLIQ